MTVFGFFEGNKLHCISLNSPVGVHLCAQLAVLVVEVQGPPLNRGLPALGRLHRVAARRLLFRLGMILQL